ncbi:PAS domain-containing protein [Terriglobus roseus DSM 18391]|uniref:PAS domain-containing protein n=1 Tax=Terriglobus roseus (strain DSM 18391 / NRRL B-41598 / KBS 63) TaxID=926566 RepID=I3ZIY5_TERRK|nr:PAS domain-containing protein [Terriglobus roseus]AFL89203.1 PAS domain-containing protein [Terriglobus roseus DSM 18391]
MNKSKALLQSLSPSLCESLESLSQTEGTSLDDLLIVAIAEKIARSEHSAWLAEQQSWAVPAVVGREINQRPYRDSRNVSPSERENAGLELPKSDEEQERQRTADLFESAPVFLALLSGPDHVFELVNQAYRELLGNRALIGKRVVEGVPELAGTACIDRLDRVYRNGEPLVERGTRFSFAPTQGQALEEKYIDYAYRPRRSADGTITGILVLGVDTSLVHQLVQGTVSEVAAIELLS